MLGLACAPAGRAFLLAQHELNKLPGYDHQESLRDTPTDMPV
jgi:hypothetical protein